MTSRWSRSLWASILLSILAVTHVVGDTSPFAFFRSDIELDESARRRLREGQVLATMLSASGRHLGFFGALGVDAGPRAVRELLADMPEFREGPKVLVTHVFSDPPRLDDLNQLALDSRDLGLLKSCRLHDCNIKLTGPEIRRVQQVVQRGGADVDEALQETFRRIVLARVETYLAGGLRGTAPIESRADPVDLGERFSEVLAEMPTIAEQRPELARYLDEYPHAPPPAGTRSLFYWTVEDLRHPVMVVRHVVIIESDGADGEPTVGWVSKQVMATHYLDASVSYSGLVPGDGSSPPYYFVYLNRSELDILDGFPAWLRRRMVHRGVQRESTSVLEGLRDKVERRGKGIEG